MAKKTAKQKSTKSDSWSGVSEDVQKGLIKYLSDELDVAKRNNAKVQGDFEDFYHMVHCIRDAKAEVWRSDISLPEFLSRLLTQIGNFATQYFGSTDYVETDIDSDDPKDVAEAKAAKKLLNHILNDKDTYYYQKIIRLLMFVFPTGYGIIKGYYNQQTEQVISHYNQRSELSVDPETGEYMADDGLPYSDPTMQRAAFNTIQEPVYKTSVIVDRPEFDVYPNQNVFMSPEYTYSLNDKEWIVFEGEGKTLASFRTAADRMGYFNLDLLEKEEPEGERGSKTYNRDGQYEEHPQPPEKVFIPYERWGRFPYIAYDDGTFKPGIDENGVILPDAELGECIITYVKCREADDIGHIVGFRKSNHSKRPMARFLCYVDAVNDNGFGDGEANRELNIAMDDNFNLMYDRARMAMTPAFKGKKFMGLPETIQYAPGYIIPMENPDSDLKEMVIQDNIQGGIAAHNLLASRMDFVMATAPQTMGQSADRAETATQASIINQRASIRIGMKSMNQEFIGFAEFYDMLLTMCDDFMLPETLENILGDLAFSYNPKRKNKFKPVSQALETEESKQFKIRTLQGMLQVVGSVMHLNPKAPRTMNAIIGEIFETHGKKFKHIKKFLLEDNPETVALYQIYTGSQGQGTAPMPQNPMAPPQNQSGLPQQQPEQAARMMAPNQTMRGMR